MDARKWSVCLVQVRLIGCRREALVSSAGTGIAHGDSMSRDHTKLRFFSTADELTIAIYRVTESPPATERYGLQSQMRRASVSIVTNVVEGACRRTDRAYSQF